MVAAWVAGLAVAALVLAPADALAKQRGNGRLKNNGNGNGPAFCRSGAGHPVHGWAWCRERGWSRDGSFDRERGRERDDRARQRDDRDRDRSERSRFPWPF